MSWKWFGQAGHFCAANQCRFHLHTHIGKYCVSTVGDYYPRGSSIDGPDTIGLDRLYETMVFIIQDDGETNGQNIDFNPYNDRISANAGHLEMCLKYEERIKDKK